MQVCKYGSKDRKCKDSISDVVLGFSSGKLIPVTKRLTEHEKEIMNLFDTGKLIDITESDISEILINYYKTLSGSDLEKNLENIKKVLSDIDESLALAHANLSDKIKYAQTVLCQKRFPDMEFYEVHDKNNKLTGYKCLNPYLNNFNVDLKRIDSYVPICLDIAEKQKLDTKITEKLKGYYGQWKAQKGDLKTLEKNIIETCKLSSNGKSLLSTLMDSSDFMKAYQIAILKERLRIQGSRRTAYNLRKSCIKIVQQINDTENTQKDLETYAKSVYLTVEQITAIFEK